MLLYSYILRFIIFCIASVRLAVLAAFQKQLILRQMSFEAIHVEAAGAAAAATQERTYRPALAGVADSVAEHFVDLLLWGHPPVWVWGTVHPDKLWKVNKSYSPYWKIKAQLRFESGFWKWDG